jgi:taurine dioxygenase
VGGSPTDTLQLAPLEPPFAAEVGGLDLTDAGAGDFERLRAILDEQPVLVLRDQHLDPGELVAIARGFGEPERYDEPSPGYEDQPEIAAFSNDAERGIVTRPFWHTDGLGRPEPPELTIFYAVEAPSSGGETLFVDARALYDELEAADRQTLGELVAEVRGGARHPLVKRHPRTGRMALYANLGATTELVGVERDAAEGVFAELWDLYDGAPTYRHRYRQGDLLVWDDYAVAHSASDPPPPGERRLLLRVDVRPAGGDS